MAQHLLLVILDDELGDYVSEEKLSEFVQGLKDSFHEDLTVRSYYEVPDVDSTVSAGEWILDQIVEMQSEIAENKGN